MVIRVSLYLPIKNRKLNNKHLYMYMLHFCKKSAAPTKAIHIVKIAQNDWLFSKPTGGFQTRKSPTQSLLDGS